MNDHIQNIIIKAKDRASKILSKVGSVVKMVSRSVFSLKGAFVALGSAMAVKGIVDKAMGAFMRMENAMIGLSSVANKMGMEARTALGYVTVDAESAKQAAQDLAGDGLMSVDDAATSLKNLLLAGFGLPQAVDMINAFKDSAAFGRQSALSFGDAIRSAAEGVKNENSVLVDNAGITKNLSIMHKEYAASLGKTVAQLTESEKKQAVYQGIMQESSAMMGDAERMTNTYQGAVASLDNSVFMLWRQIGDFLAPVLKDLINDHLKPVIDETSRWAEINKDAISAKLRAGMDWFIDKLQTLKAWIAGDAEAANIFAGAINGLKSSFFALERTLKTVQTAAQSVLDTIEKISNFGGGFLYGMANPIDVIADRLSGQQSTVEQMRIADGAFTAEDLYGQNLTTRPITMDNVQMVPTGQPQGALP